jgi:hypothetical protein
MQKLFQQYARAHAQVNTAWEKLQPAFNLLQIKMPTQRATRSVGRPVTRAKAGQGRRAASA